MPAQDFDNSPLKRSDIQRPLQPVCIRQIELRQLRQFLLNPQQAFLHNRHRMRAIFLFASDIRWRIAWRGRCPCIGVFFRSLKSSGQSCNGRCFEYIRK